MPRADGSAYAADYVGRYGLSLALDPDDAAPLSRQWSLGLTRTSNRTYYVRIPTERLQDASLLEHVEKVADDAMQRSWQGPRWQRGLVSGASASLQPTCPLHHHELAVNGFCMECDDIAPEV